MNTIKTKTLAALLVSLPLTSTSVFAGELNSFSHQVKVNDYDQGYQKTEWTLGLGSYQLNDDYKFLFDVDKDFVEKSDGTSQQGWDTQFGISHDLTTLAGFDVSLSYLIRYDASWNTKDGSDSSNAQQYIITPWLSKGVEIAEKDFALGIELWAQVGTSNEGSLQDISGVETNFYLDGALTDNWELNLSWYNFNYYDSEDDEYDYQIGTEDYLTYSLPLNENFTFNVESYVEAYHTIDEKSTEVYAHIAPELKYTLKLNESVNGYAAVSYDVVKYEYFKSEGSAGTHSWKDNELEITLGAKF
ncbi:hypothetical protein [Vibrio sp. MA40-2]|uniref:hypothetical protein n=1 Tax=Vibrio sp. MA40-2 TaxID=3391828 RepID=UPI0039A45A9A